MRIHRNLINTLAGLDDTQYRVVYHSYWSNLEHLAVGNMAQVLAHIVESDTVLSIERIEP